MKSILPLMLGIFFLHVAFGQAIDSTQITYLSHYLLPNFVKGTVKQKNGGVQEATLNYNSMTREMIFVQNGTYLALGELENIDTVFIENRKFIPAGGLFYEVVPVGQAYLYINHKCKIIPPGNPGGYGTTSQTSSPGNISKIAGNSIMYNLKLPSDYKVIPETEFLLKKDNEYSRIFNAKQVAKLFPAKADAIQDYAKKNKINFKNQEDVAKLVLFCNQPS